MCVIVDANRAALVVDPDAPEFEPLRRWLEDRGALVHGGRLTTELVRVASVQRWLVALQRKGAAILADSARVETETNRLEADPALRSDDPHVVALARVSGARTLCTEDAALMDDFRNRSLVPAPKGRIYRTAAHAHCLCHSRGCPRYGRR